MTSATIKVPSTVRDALTAQAAAPGRTLGEHLQYLIDEQARRDRFSDLARAMASHPPDEEYLSHAHRWQGDQWS